MLLLYVKINVFIYPPFKQVRRIKIMVENNNILIFFFYSIFKHFDHHSINYLIYFHYLNFNWLTSFPIQTQLNYLLIYFSDLPVHVFIITNVYYTCFCKGSIHKIKNLNGCLICGFLDILCYNIVIIASYYRQLSADIKMKNLNQCFK